MIAQSVVVPVLCPVDGCWECIDVTVPWGIHIGSTTPDANGSYECRADVVVDTSGEALLAEVELHVLTEHPEFPR